jgi:uncharacterized protein with NRDE domain
MCVILFAAGAHPRFPLIVAANRDEAYARPASPAAFWSDSPHIYAGRDLEQGGTWLGLSRDGRFAAITNYRQGIRNGDAPRSRGELTRDYLTGGRDIEDYLGEVSRRYSDYHGFSMIAGTPERLYFCSNRAERIEPITPGVHGLSNRLLDEPWPKVRRGIAVIEGLLGADEMTLTRELFELLGDTSTAPDHLLPSTGIALERERDLSAVFIAGSTYGTRASTVVLVNAQGEVLYIERSFGPGGAPKGTTEQRFHLERSAKALALDRT